MKSNHMNDSNNNKVGILDINYDTGRAYWGPQLRDLLGVAREVPVDFHLLLKLVHPDDRRALNSIRAKTLRPGCPTRQEVEFRIVDSAGEVRWLHAEVRVEFRATGSRDVVRVGAVVIDVGRLHLEASGWVAGQMLLLAKEPITKELTTNKRGLAVMKFQFLLAGIVATGLFASAPDAVAFGPPPPPPPAVHPGGGLPPAGFHPAGGLPAARFHGGGKLPAAGVHGGSGALHGGRRFAGSRNGPRGGGAIARGLANANGGELGRKLQGTDAGQLRNNLSPERNQAIANRQQYWDKWVKDNQGKLTNFLSNRSQEWGNINNFRKNQNVAGSFNNAQWNDYKNNVDNFRNNRSTEINNSIQNHFDNNFNGNWWRGCGWYDGSAYWGDNAYWWWGAATLATADTFLAIDASEEATYQTPLYDYGVNVVYQGDDVYVDGKKTATAEECSQQAIALANEPAAQPPAPTPPESGQQPEWLPLGVWALTQEEKGDAYMFFQLSIDKNGVVSGAYQNVLSGEKSPISGQVDKKTQRVAWKMGTNNTVIETGLPNLTQDVASCLVHFGPDTTQTWLLVRLKQPEMPNAPQTAAGETKQPKS